MFRGRRHISANVDPSNVAADVGEDEAETLARFLFLYLMLGNSCLMLGNSYLYNAVFLPCLCCPCPAILQAASVMHSG